MKEIKVEINFEKIVGLEYPIEKLLVSEGLEKHLKKRHPQMIKYIDDIPDFVNHPDYYGFNLRQPIDSFECIKIVEENVLVAIKFDKKGKYYYVSSIYDVTEGKLEHMIKNGRIVKFDK